MTNVEALKATLALAVLKWGNLNPDANEVFARADIAITQLAAEISSYQGVVKDWYGKVEAADSALAIERDRAEKAERELDLAQVVISEWGYTKERAEAAEASLSEAKRLLKPFADNASGGDGTGFLDVPDGHAARFHDLSNPTTPTLTEGDFRAAARFLAQEGARPTEEPQR